MSDDPSTIRARATAVSQAGSVLRSATRRERVRWLAEAAITLAQNARSRVGALSETTGLSVPMVEWALRSTLETIQEHALLDLAEGARGRSQRAERPVALLSIILAGNVFTAPIRGIIVPLVMGAPVLVKSSSKETLLPAMLRDACRQVDAQLGASLDVVSFAGGQVDCETALVEEAEAVSVYGSDPTVAAIAARLVGKRLIAHGHGVSVAYCGAHALESATVTDTIERLALDICAYDQRGCLSPQWVYVEETSRVSIIDFAERLAQNGLQPMAESLPRGPLPAFAGAAQAQWRGIAEVEGSLIRGDRFSIAVRSAGPVRWSPAYRNVTLLPVQGMNDAMRAMKPLGSKLKCIGVDSESMAECQELLGASQGLSAYACPLGQMQTPALDAPADGRPIWHGLFRGD